MVRRRVQIRFRKEGELRLIGHLDLVRAWERLLRRAGVPLEISGGCHPRPRIRFPSALPMGEAGTDEVLEVDFQGTASADEICADVRRCAPAGLNTTQVVEVPVAAPCAELNESAYEFPVPLERQAETERRLEQLLTESTLLVDRGDGEQFDLRGLLLGANLTEGVLRFRLRGTRGRSLRPRDILAALELDDLREQGLYPVRTEVVLA